VESLLPRSRYIPAVRRFAYCYLNLTEKGSGYMMIKKKSPFSMAGKITLALYFQLNQTA
jgi:hypothetical protein